MLFLISDFGLNLGMAVKNRRHISPPLPRHPTHRHPGSGFFHDHLRWPDLDVDIDLLSRENPDAYPLVFAE